MVRSRTMHPPSHTPHSALYAPAGRAPFPRTAVRVQAHGKAYSYIHFYAHNLHVCNLHARRLHVRNLHVFAVCRLHLHARTTHPCVRLRCVLARRHLTCARTLVRACGHVHASTRVSVPACARTRATRAGAFGRAHVPCNTRVWSDAITKENVETNRCLRQPLPCASCVLAAIAVIAALSSVHGAGASGGGHSAQRRQREGGRQRLRAPGAGKQSLALGGEGSGRGSVGMRCGGALRYQTRQVPERPQCPQARPSTSVGLVQYLNGINVLSCHSASWESPPG
eukprot:3638803-Pleurochrysis_carterae.AAC.1